MSAEAELRRLLDIMVALRAPVGGCPWDIAQDFDSIAPYTIEEAYEVADAIARRDFAALPDELGDLLFQVVYHARMAEEDGRFGFAEVAKAISDKMIRRHPHVFGAAAARDAAMQSAAWEAQKVQERAARAEIGVLAGIPVGLPALTRAQKLTARAARVGFDWPDAAAVLDKLEEEAAELRAELAVGDRARLADEVGDLLFVLANLARKLELDPERCLREANLKFERRFGAVEAALAAEGRTPGEATLGEMEAAWGAAKVAEKGVVAGDPFAAVHRLPRVRLAQLPTALERMDRLGAAVGVEKLYVKRDDCTGLGLGGNKLRKLEFCLAAAREAGAEVVVCGGVVQSNTARQVAASCAKLGLECHLGIMRGRLAETEPGYEESGNILLDRLFGAVVHDIVWSADRNTRLREIADGLRAAGRKVYFVPYGASDALGAMGYVLAAREILRACPEAGFIVHGSGTGGTQAGLIAGVRAMGHAARVIGVDVDAEAARVAADVGRVGRAVAGMLGTVWDDGDVEVAGDWSGPGYGVSDAATEEAIRLAARLEGLVVDPVYAGKGLAGLIGLARQGRFAGARPVVWLHTGGAPGVFAYPETMRRLSDAI